MSAGVEAILLLGVALGEDDAPTEELRARVQAAAHAHRLLGCPVMPCGGRTPGHARSECAVMTQLLLESGVAQAAILTEDQSQDTMGNFLCASRVLGGAKGRRVLVVTSDYHMRRALMTARRVGFRAKGQTAALAHDEAWKQKRAKELGYTIDLIMGWQDEGKARPAWTYRLFDRVFGRR